MSDVLIKSLGHHAEWGLSATFDLVDAIEASCGPDESCEPLNILLVNPGDIRHVVYTLSRKRRHCQRPVHFYLLETPCEVLARDILLLEVFVDFEVPIRQRGNVFLEIYGNAKVQERTARYIEQMGQKLRAMCTGGSSTLDLLDLSHLRYRERDALEEVFKSYSRKFACDMTSLREHRMRGYYEERYDARRALGDWDYQYTLRETIASIIHITLYRDWREKGVAFEFGDQTYEEGNRTMMTYVEGAMKRGKNAGDHKEIRGFWGDIVASPYFAFGVDADSSSPPLSATAASYADGLFEILNKGTGSEQHRHHAVEVAVYNMFCMLWEVEMGTPYTMLKKNDIFSGLGQLDKEQVVSRPAELDPQVESAENGEDLPVVEELFDIAEEGDDECHDGNEEKGDGAANILHSTAAIDPAGGGDVDGNAVQAAMEEEEFVKELRRAECIVETFQGARVFPLTGGSAQEILKKEKYRCMFDGVFISNRSAQFVNDPLINTILKDTIDGKKCLVAVETAKYCIPLLRNQRKEFNVKLKEYGISQGWNHCITPPVRRRRRDSADDMDDVMFFVKSAEDCSAATSEEA